MPWAPKKSMSEAGRVLNNSNSISLQNDGNCPPNIFYHIINLSKKQKNLPDIQKGFHDLSGNRTRVSAVRGRRLSRLTNRLICRFRQLPYNTIGNWICPDKFQKNMKKILDCKKHPIN